MYPNRVSPYRSVKEIEEFLYKNSFKTENEIQESVFNYYRNETSESNKKYADMLRRGLVKGTIKRVWWTKRGTDRAYYYYFSTKGYLEL